MTKFLPLIQVALRLVKLDALKGYRTKVAAAGLFLLGVADVLNDDTAGGLNKVFTALAVLGIREAVPGEGEQK